MLGVWRVLAGRAYPEYYRKVRIMFSSHVFTAKSGKTLSYLMTVPDGADTKSEKLPLVVFLHGAGERGTDTELLKVYGIPKLFLAPDSKYRALSLSPQCPAGETFLNNIDNIAELIKKVAKEYNADESRISLTGLSMGGFGTFELAMQYPELFCAIAPCCGGGMEWRAGLLKNVPVWAFHGAMDAVVPCSHSVDMVKAINAYGGNAKITVYADLPHNCWRRAYEEDGLCPWLLAQRKD